MEDTLTGLKRPKFRPSVGAIIHQGAVQISLGDTRCAFDISPAEAAAVTQLIYGLRSGGRTLDELASQSPEIAEQIPDLLQDFDRLRLLVETEEEDLSVITGAQLYREVRRLADRVAMRAAKSAFYTALLTHTASRAQIVGYALEYYWIVKMAPGLIGPALATASSPKERQLLQDFLRSELGHDRFLARALHAVGVTDAELEAHQPLPATFALCASLGVYARQHPLSFKAVLFLFERAQPAFVDAFDEQCRTLGLPETFYGPLRAHADLNADYDHEDISNDLLVLEGAVDFETTVVVKRHVALMMETMIQQESEILAFYGQLRERTPRIFSES